MDRYKIVAFEDEPDEDYGILVNLRRISDGKNFTLPLADLEATDNKNPSHLLLDDYSVCLVSWRLYLYNLAAGGNGGNHAAPEQPLYMTKIKEEK